MSEGSGSWLEYIEFDGKVYWTINDEIPEWQIPNADGVSDPLHEYLLPSDSANRPDLKHMLDKNFNDAEREKHVMEE